MMMGAEGIRAHEKHTSPGQVLRRLQALLSLLGVIGGASLPEYRLVPSSLARSPVEAILKVIVAFARRLQHRADRPKPAGCLFLRRCFSAAVAKPS
uniref:Secreted protein n=1 Tax=Steinernema glaseri TaxID=37863 RepID=A0A1I7Y5M0_9BILA